MSLESNCPRGTDDQFGPRVNVLCRQFDFTLLFEDAFFTMLPAALFLLVFPVRLQALRHASVKLKSYKLAIGKLVCTHQIRKLSGCLGLTQAS